jgi:hypothetical protein
MDEIIIHEKHQKHEKIFMKRLFVSFVLFVDKSQAAVC